MELQGTRTALLVLAGVLVAAPAWAVDGVIEINQASALAGGGFPVTISKSGSYRLTSNLDVTVAGDAKNTTAIRIVADDVTIDLNGFAIIGPTVCSGSPPAGPTCNPTGLGMGVFVSSGANTTVVNGTVRGMGDTGLELGRGSRVERVRAFSNGRHGMFVSIGSIVSGCYVNSNGEAGIFTDINSLVLDNVTSPRMIACPTAINCSPLIPL